MFYYVLYQVLLRFYQGSVLLGFIRVLLGFIIREIVVGDETFTPGLFKLGEIDQDFSGTPATSNEAIITTSYHNNSIKVHKFGSEVLAETARQRQRQQQ